MSEALNKDGLRREARALRRALRNRYGLAEDLWSRFWTHEELVSSGARSYRSLHVAAYVAVRDELDTRPLLDERFGRGLDVVLPRVDGTHLQLCRVQSWDELETGHFGILEPLRRLPRECLVDPAEVDLTFVPGLAFDDRGGRLGYGKGHYDRLLAQLRPEVPRIGLCFEEQIVEEVPMEEHDVPMTHLATPARVVACRPG